MKKLTVVLDLWPYRSRMAVTAMEGKVLVVAGAVLIFIIGLEREMGGLRAAEARYSRPG